MKSSYQLKKELAELKKSGLAPQTLVADYKEAIRRTQRYEVLDEMRAREQRINNLMENNK